MWKEVAKLIPFAVSQLNFWKFGIARGTYNITLPDWRVKVYNLFHYYLNYRLGGIFITKVAEIKFNCI